MVVIHGTTKGELTAGDSFRTAIHPRLAGPALQTVGARASIPFRERDCGPCTNNEANLKSLTVRGLDLGGLDSPVHNTQGGLDPNSLAGQDSPNAGRVH